MQNIRSVAVLVKTESVTGTGGTLSPSTDYITVQPGSPPAFQRAPLYNGVRGPGAFSGAQMRPTVPAAFKMTGQIAVEAKGKGSSYTTANDVPNLSALLFAAGYSGSMSGSDAVFKPRAVSNTNYTSCLGVYDKGTITPISGAAAILGFSAEAGKPAVFTFDIQGAAGTTVNASIPSITEIAPLVNVPVFSGANLTLGGFSSSVCTKVEFQTNQQIKDRLNGLAATGYQGTVLSFERDPKFTVTIEAENLSAYDPFNVWTLGTDVAIDLELLGGSNNKVRYRSNQSRISNIQHTADGEIGYWQIEFTAYASNSGANDDHEFWFRA